MIEWEAYTEKTEEKDTDTPMLARVETHYHGCCQHRCWAEGELSISARVCACRRLTVIWGLFSDDSCWHNAPFSLFIYTVQPISISSLFLTPLPLFFSQFLASKFHSFTHFLIFRISLDLWWDAHLLSACSSNKLMPFAHPGTCRARLLLISFLEQ